MVVRSRNSNGSIQETETKRVHTYGKAWALQVRGSCVSLAASGRGVVDVFAWVCMHASFNGRPPICLPACHSFRGPHSPTITRPSCSSGPYLPACAACCPPGWAARARSRPARWHELRHQCWQAQPARRLAWVVWDPSAAAPPHARVASNKRCGLLARLQFKLNPAAYAPCLLYDALLQGCNCLCIHNRSVSS